MTMDLHSADWVIIGLYVLLAVGLGTWFSRRASSSVDSFFVGGRDLPWWLAGTSIVATTFAADTPLAVTGIVASGGISGNWIWWSWAVAHVVATFLFARMWRRSGVITDAEITELRYSGRAAAGLRAFKALYFGLFINCLTMAWVIAAMVKISRAFFQVDPAVVIVICVVVAVVYTILGGFRSVVATDLVQFLLGMGGAVALAWLVLRGFGGMGAPGLEGSAGAGLLGALDATLAAGGQQLEQVLAFVPGVAHPEMPLLFFAALMIAGWWRQAEGNGYLVQRLAACRDERHAQAASLWFAVAHNALRPWPWFVVGLAALVVYPQLQTPDSLQGSWPAGGQLVVSPASIDIVRGGELQIQGAPAGSSYLLAGARGQVVETTESGATVAFPAGPATGHHTLEIRAPDGDAAQVPGVAVQLADREMAYPLLMGSSLPAGLLGVVIASLLAAFMSTIDTHTNWGASYLVQDIYLRFLRPQAGQREAVAVSRLAIVLMAVLAGITALFVQNIASVWVFLINLGAGLGSVTAARWYWSRVTPQAEFTALGVTTALALALLLFATPTLFGGPNPFFWHEVPAWAQILLIAGASLASWVPVALWGPANDPATLRSFARLVRPGGPSWAPFRERAADPIAPALLRVAAGLLVVYCALFGIGDLLLGRPLRGLLLAAVACGALAWILLAGRHRSTTSTPPHLAGH